MKGVRLRTILVAVATIALLLAPVGRFVRDRDVYEARAFIEPAGDPAALADRLRSETFLRAALASGPPRPPGGPAPRADLLRRLTVSVSRGARPRAILLKLRSTSPTEARWTFDAIFQQVARDGLGRVVPGRLPLQRRGVDGREYLDVIVSQVAFLLMLYWLRRFMRALRAARATAAPG